MVSCSCLYLCEQLCKRSCFSSSRASLVQFVPRPDAPFAYHAPRLLLENCTHSHSPHAQFAAKKAAIRQAKAELDAQARFLENEAVNNKEVDARIAFYDREIVSV